MARKVSKIVIQKIMAWIEALLLSSEFYAKRDIDFSFFLTLNIDIGSFLINQLIIFLTLSKQKTTVLNSLAQNRGPHQSS